MLRMVMEVVMVLAVVGMMLFIMRVSKKKMILRLTCRMMIKRMINKLYEVNNG